MAALAAASIRDKRRRQATADAHKSTPGGRRDSDKETPGGDITNRNAVGSSRSSVDWQQVRDELRQTEVRLLLAFMVSSFHLSNCSLDHCCFVL